MNKIIGQILPLNQFYLSAIIFFLIATLVYYLSNSSIRGDRGENLKYEHALTLHGENFTHRQGE